jgi:hypothetical protein
MGALHNLRPKKNIRVTYRLVDISDDRRTYYQKRRALKCCQDPEDEEGCQIGCQGSSDTETSEQCSAYD